MPSTGINNGTITSLYFGGTAVAHSTNCSVAFSMDTRDATTKSSSGWRDLLESTRSASASGECFFAEDAAYGFTDLFALINTRATVAIKHSSGVIGDLEYTGTAYITSLEQANGLEDNATYSFSLEFTGAVTEGTIS